MNDPKRWLDEGGGATFEERALLDAGRRASMPSALRKRVWIGVAAGAAGLGTLGEAAGATGTASATKSALATLIGSSAAKGVVAVALVGGAGLGWAALRSPSKAVIETTVSLPAPAIALPEAPLAEAPMAKASPAPTTMSSMPSVHDAPGAAASLGSARDETSSSRRAGGPGRAPSAKALAAPARGEARAASESVNSPEEQARPSEAPVPSRAATRLREESAAVLAARKTLLRGDAEEALRMLERARTDFPNGALLEEREALAVRALVASGQNELARKRGDAFLRAFPRSPHASEVRAVIAP